MNQPDAPGGRIAGAGTRVDWNRRISFTFDGRRIDAYEGDTYASALAAAGTPVLSRSFKYHRPRGLLCCAGRCPNCMVKVDGVPNVRACVARAADGASVSGQNAWPSVKRDLFGGFDHLDRVLPVGFYYKTFIKPRVMWPVYEGVLRRLAGLGSIDPAPKHRPEPVKKHLFCDVAVIGGGPAGSLAAIEAATAGARVVLIDDQEEIGGHLAYATAKVSGDTRLDELRGIDAAFRLRAMVAGTSGIEHLASTTAFGIYEGNLIGASSGDTLCRVRARQILIATGAFERPLLFENNDRPGVMLPSAILRLVALYGVRAGRRAVVVTDSDHGWTSVLELLAAGFEVSGLVDSRNSGIDAQLAAAVRGHGVPAWEGVLGVRAEGRNRVRGIRFESGGKRRTISADVVAMASRPEPVLALLAQAGAKPLFDSATGSFVPGNPPDGIAAVGHAEGLSDISQVLQRGVGAGRLAAQRALGEQPGTSPIPAPATSTDPAPRPPSTRKAFVCLCEDVTVKDIKLAIREGFDAPETVKRYSTVTMGPCQGKMCHSLSAAVHAGVTGQSVEQTGLTTARPPFQPVTLAALAGPHLAPERQTALHDRHVRLNARWTDMGDWKRPHIYSSVAEEYTAVREAAGIIDVSTLGKLQVTGRDAGEFLDWLHPNRFSDLRIGRVRYRAMTDDAGIVLDDGTVARLGPERFFLTTGTGAFDAVEQWLQWWLAGSSRDVQTINITSQFAAINLAGPRSRDVIKKLTSGDVSNKAMPYLAAVETDVAGVPAIILRIGFVGELGFEIHVPADYGAHVWDALLEAGSDLDIRPFGVEAQRVLRLEKLHIIPGQDTDALSNPVDAGLGWIVKPEKKDFIGRDSLAALGSAAKRPLLVGFEVTGGGVPGEGAAVVHDRMPVGRVTSCKWSPGLKRAVGLAWVNAEHAADGTPLTIRLGEGADGKTTTARVHVAPFHDPEGARLRGAG